LIIYTDEIVAKRIFEGHHFNPCHLLWLPLFSDTPDRGPEIRKRVIAKRDLFLT
jgi:hypothetical protein